LKPRDIVFMASRDWEGLPLQSHFLAEGYARRGHRVFYINQTLQKWPRLEHFRKRFLSGRSTGRVDSYADRVQGVQPVTMLLGPPESWLRPLNRRLIRRALAPYWIESPAFVSWVPTYNCLDMMALLKPYRTAYVNYHHFEADDVLPALLEAERKVVASVDLLFTDSLFLNRRISEMSGGREVHRSMPGVYLEPFRTARRGDELERRRHVMYFGEIGTHLDLDAYNTLAEHYDVTMVGVLTSAARERLSSRVTVRPPVSVFDLPDVLRDADVLATLYLDSPYMLGVLPSKFFECLATGKPLLVSGLEEVRPYGDVVHYLDGGGAEALQVMERLQELETPAVTARRDELAAEADWERRFEHFAGILDA